MKNGCSTRALTVDVAFCPGSPADPLDNVTMQREALALIILGMAMGRTAIGVNDFGELAVVQVTHPHPRRRE